MRSVPWTALAALTLVLGIGACGKSGGKGKDTTNNQTGDSDDPAADTDDPAADTDDPASDTDDPSTDIDGGGDDDPVDNNATPPRAGTTFCAAGGRWSNGQVQGVGCLAPLDVATQAASNDQYRWQPGPTVVVGGQ